ncbi:8729_t:CDS:1, partial [Dentiscutata erythropus]
TNQPDCQTARKYDKYKIDNSSISINKIENSTVDIQGVVLKIKIINNVSDYNNRPVKK